MDIQFYGANCISVSYKGTRLVIDDNMAELGAKQITKAEDVALSTVGDTKEHGRIYFNSPGEYEVSDISIIGIPAQSHTEEKDKKSATMFKISASDQSVLITGHIYPQLSDAQLESIGKVDLMLVPVGGNGYTIDPTGALSLIKSVEPKVVIPTHFEDKDLKYSVPQQPLNETLKILGMEPKETVAKYRIKPSELSDVTQVVLLEKSK